MVTPLVSATWNVHIVAMPHKNSLVCHSSVLL